MAVPVNFLRNKNPNFNLRGALKVNAIFATDDAVGTEPFQGWLADNTVVTSFNDALIENRIGVVDTDGFNIIQSNRFAFTTMSEGQRIVKQNFIRVKFASPIDPTNGTYNFGDILEFESNLEPFGSLSSPSNGKQYRIYSVIREKDILIDSISSITNNGNGTWTVVLNTDFREDLQAYSPSTSTGNNIEVGNSVVIFGNSLVTGGTSTSLNGTYVLDDVTSTSITYTTTSDPLGGSSVSFTGKFYKITNELILIETLRAVATGVSYNSGSQTVDVTGALQGTISQGQLVSGVGVAAGTVVVGYNLISQVVTVSTPFTANVGGGTLTFELEDSQTDVVIPIGAVAASGSPQMFIDAGVVTESITVKTPINYYVYGDTRLKYFWSSYTQDGTFNGWTQNVSPDGFLSLYEGGVVGSGETLQLIGSDPAFASEDTFNNLIKTLGISRGTGLAGDYSPVGRSALLYISATDSQGDTGTGGGPKGRGTSTPAYTVNETIDYLNAAGGYWIGVIGGSFTDGCQNEIQTFRKDTLDGILGDPRGFIPIKGEVTSVRVGVPVDNIFYETSGQTINGVSVPSGSVVIQTYYDHAFGSPEDRIRVRVKNNTNSPFDINGLRDIVVISDNQFYFTFPDDVGTLTNVSSFDECGYILNVSALLTVPTGFYRKSTFEYVDPTTVNDNRSIVTTGDGFTLSEQPGVGRDRKDILVTIGVTESTGTLQYFSMYPVGDFFSGLPETSGTGTPYFAYPSIGTQDIKFRVNTINIGSTEFIEYRDAEDPISDLLDPGTTEVTPRDEFQIVIYPIEYTAEVAITNNSSQIVVENLSLYDGSGADGRDFARITNAGSTYNDGILAGDPPEFSTTFAADDVTTTATSGSGTGLKFDIQFIGGSVDTIRISDRGTGYAPGDTGIINAPTGGNVTPGNEATYIIRSIDDVDFSGLEWTLEIFDPSIPASGDDFISQGNNWTNPAILSSKTQVEVDTIQANTPSAGQYTINLSKPIIGSINDTVVAFCYPNDFRKLNVFVKPSNNFKDINAEAAIAANLIPATSDASITFSGYGYGKGDILTPSDVTNSPASIVSAVWTRDTEITQDGFLWSGQSVGTGGPFNITNVNGNQEGTGAAFRVTPTIIGLYNVELLDAGINYQVQELLVIPGYDLGGSEVPIFADLNSVGSGYNINDVYTNQSTTVLTGNGDGNLTFNFETDASGSIDIGTLEINTPGDGYNIGDTGEITGGTTNAIYSIVNTENDLIITITEVINNSNVLVTTANPHGFIPPLGRTTVDILVQGVISSASIGNFNGRKVAEVIDATTLQYDQEDDPGIYSTGGTIFNVSPDVVNDTFSSFRNELFLNINVTPNDPGYPKIVFIDSVSYTNPTVTVTTSTPHKLVTGERVQVSGMKFTRLVGEEINAGNVQITVTGANTFTYSKAVGGNTGDHIPGTGEITNPYAKVLGGVYTKDFYRIVFVNTSNTAIPIVDENNDPIPGEVIEPDKTRDFLVRDINFRQISNDGDIVADGPKHDFYVTATNELAIIARGIDNIDPVIFTSITYIEESLEFEVTTSTPHGLWEGNYFELILDGNNTISGVSVEPARIAEYEPGGANQLDEVSLRISDTVFRYKVYSAGRTDNTYPVGPRSTTDIDGDGGDGLGSCVKTVGQGGGDYDTFLGPASGTSQDLIKFSGLKGFPGVQPDQAYYLVTVDPNTEQGDTTLLKLQISETRSGTPLTFSLDVVGATYNRSTEEARIDVSGLTPHGLTEGDVVRISGVSSSDYNGTQTVSFIVSPTSFTYPVPPISGTADTVNDSFTKNIISGGTTWNFVDKRVNGTSGTNVITILSGAGRQRYAGDIVEGMLVTGLGQIPAGTYVTDASQLPNIILSQPLTGNITGGGSIADFTAGGANTGNFGSIALANSGTFPLGTNVVSGQKVSGTGIGVDARVLKVVEFTFSGTTYAYAVVDKAHTQALNSANTFTFEDNLSGFGSIRLTNVTGGVPQVGAEIESTGGSGNIFSSNTLTTEVKPYSISGTDGYIIGVSKDLLLNFTDQTVKLYPDENPSVTSASVSPITASYTPDGVTVATTEAQEDYILDPTNTIAGQLQLTADTSGWDHVSLAKETGGALFFQLGFPLLCSGTVNQNTITVSATTPIAALTALFADLGADTIGVYGEGIAPGATISNIGGNTITLTTGFNNVKTFTNEYVGFARPNSVSVFPKYTSEFGRILGKTFAEWLFKIA